MKNYLLPISVLCIPVLSFAQVKITNANGSTWIQCTKFAESRPLRELAKEHPASAFKGNKFIEAPDKEANRNEHKKHFTPNNNPDPVMQTWNGNALNSGPIQSFDGQTSSEGYVPLDCNGMVGPNDFVQTVNSDYQVFDKMGNPLTSSIELNNLFSSIATNGGNQGDPVTIYDKFADRWIIEEFDGIIYNGIMFAVSKTSDPTGAYYLFYFTPTLFDFDDYPKFTIWSNGIYETGNIAPTDEVVVYDRTKMENGDNTAGLITIPFNNSPTGTGNDFFCPMVLDADGTLPPYNSPEYLFYYTDDNWGGGTFNDQILIDQITVDWTAKTGTLTKFDSLPTAPFNSYFTGNRMCIDQPGSLNSLDDLDGFFQYRIPYMRWTGYNSAVMCYPVNVKKDDSGPTVDAGIRWYELRQDTSTSKWSIYQQGTYAPDTIVNRWLPSIAMNNDGNIGMGYSVSNGTNVYPGIRFTGRNACDTLGIMSLAEGTAMNGTATGSTSNRWGDYSNTSIDPADGITFWHTNAYFSDTGTLGYKTRIFSFQVPRCIGQGIPLIDENKTQLTAYQDGNTLEVKATELPDNSLLYAEVFTEEGKKIAEKTLQPSSGKAEVSFPITSFSTGIYFVRIGKDNFQRVVKVMVKK